MEKVAMKAVCPGCLAADCKGNARSDSCNDSAGDVVFVVRESSAFFFYLIGAGKRKAQVNSCVEPDLSVEPEFCRSF